MRSTARTVLTVIMCAVVALAPACSFLTPQQKESGRVAIQDAYEKGEITATQRDDAIEALETGDASGLDQWLYLGGSVLASVLLGVPISVGAVQKKRGPTEAQRRAAAAKPA